MLPAPAGSARALGQPSAASATSAIVRTVSVGNAPTAVSSDSISASVPSITAFATSFTSARVGNGERVIDSSICVAVITGFPDMLQKRMISFWMSGTATRRDLNAEVAARDHHRVGRGDDAGEVVERDGGLDLGDQVRSGSALGEAGAHGFDVFGPAHERQAHEVGLDPHGHAQRDRVGFGERIDVTLGTRHVHALAGAQHAVADDPALDVVAVDLLDAQHDCAVGEEHFVADPHPTREVGDGGRHAVLVAGDRLGGEHDEAAHAQLDFVAGDRPGTQLRPR